MVADQHEFGAVAGDEVKEAIEVSGGEHAGFVDDDDVAWGERPNGGESLVVVPVEELSDGLRGHAGFAAQHLGSCRGVGETDHLIAGVVPRTSSDAQHGGLAGTGGPDHDVDVVDPGSVTARNASCWSVPSWVRSSASGARRGSPR